MSSPAWLFCLFHGLTATAAAGKTAAFFGVPYLLHHPDFLSVLRDRISS